MFKLFLSHIGSDNDGCRHQPVSDLWLPHTISRPAWYALFLILKPASNVTPRGSVLPPQVQGCCANDGGREHNTTHTPTPPAPNTSHAVRPLTVTRLHASPASEGLSLACHMARVGYTGVHVLVFSHQPHHGNGKSSLLVLVLPASVLRAPSRVDRACSVPTKQKQRGVWRHLTRNRQRFTARTAVSDSLFVGPEFAHP